MFRYSSARSAFAFVLLLLALTVTTVSASVLQLTRRDAADPLAPAIGDTLEMRLSSNRTTGYEWTSRHGSGGVLTDLGGRYEADAQDPHMPPRMGAGGTDYFRFAVSRAGADTIVFRHAHPWEEAGADSFRLVVNVTAPAKAAKTKKPHGRHGKAHGAY